jgi:hypothetical protein
MRKIAGYLFLALIATMFLGCDSLMSVYVGNSTNHSIKVKTTFKPYKAESQETSRTLEPGQSYSPMPQVFGPYGEFTISVEGGRSDRFQIEEGGGGGDIEFWIGETETRRTKHLGSTDLVLQKILPALLFIGIAGLIIGVSKASGVTLVRLTPKRTNGFWSRLFKKVDRNPTDRSNL